MMNVFEECKEIIKGYYEMSSMKDVIDIEETEDYIQLVTSDPEDSETDITIYSDGTCTYTWKTGHSISDYMGVEKGELVNPEDLEYALACLIEWE